MQPPPGVYTSSVNITPTQSDHQIHREVNYLIKKSIPLAEVEAALTNNMETTTTSNKAT